MNATPTSLPDFLEPAPPGQEWRYITIAARSSIAARYADELRDGIRRLARTRSDTPTTERLRAATYRAATGVLRHSDEDADRELARDTIIDLATTRIRLRLERDAGALRRHGASIPAKAIAAAALELGRAAGIGEAEQISAQQIGPR